MVSLSTEQMRDALKQMYTSRKWKLKVSKWPDHQVAAVYFRIMSQKAA
jgi:hypothetical protein